jgi:hypothetical protein
VKWEQVKVQFANLFLVINSSKYLRVEKHAKDIQFIKLFAGEKQMIVSF